MGKKALASAIKAKMNQLTALQKQLISLSKEELVAYLGAHPDKFLETVELALSDQEPYAWRAAYLLKNSCESNDARLQQYIQSIIYQLPKKRGGHQRELLAILLKMQIDDEFEAVLFDFCVAIWKDIGNIPSVRYNALRVMTGIIEKYPELLQELSFLLDARYINSLSSGVKRAVLKMKSKLLMK